MGIIKIGNLFADRSKKNILARNIFGRCSPAANDLTMFYNYIISNGGSLPLPLSRSPGTCNRRRQRKSLSSQPPGY